MVIYISLQKQRLRQLRPHGITHGGENDPSAHARRAPLQLATGTLNEPFPCGSPISTVAVEDFWETDPDSDECSRPNPSDVRADSPSSVSNIPEKTLQESSIGRAAMARNVNWGEQLGRTRPAGSLTAMESLTGTSECLDRSVRPRQYAECGKRPVCAGNHGEVDRTPEVDKVPATGLIRRKFGITDQARAFSTRHHSPVKSAGVPHGHPDAGSSNFPILHDEVGTRTFPVSQKRVQNRELNGLDTSSNQEGSVRQGGRGAVDNKDRVTVETAKKSEATVTPFSNVLANGFRNVSLHSTSDDDDDETDVLKCWTRETTDQGHLPEGAEDARRPGNETRRKTRLSNGYR